ncbi:hypothetical protein [Paracoccus amoyensis]|uniref:hypothetical protein n=1 Tax=Paracoccus amoyensis TaxID=2760093 RepID=UPI001FE2FBD1|nr:hypothetical protein [Paracoccus amoyensis]
MGAVDHGPQLLAAPDSARKQQLSQSPATNLDGPTDPLQAKHLGFASVQAVEIRIIL